MRIVGVFFLVLAGVLAAPSMALAKVHAVSTDGEATVYLTGSLAHNFDVSYEVEYRPSRGNRSWTVISLLLLGRASPSGSIGVGLSRGSPRELALSGFTDIGIVSGAPVYRRVHVRCAEKCLIELRGSATTISALIDGRLEGTWSRRSLRLLNPYIQINGEVSAIGDQISVSLTRVRARSESGRLPTPVCAFTTQGVHARAIGDGGLLFSGRRDPRADATYVSLSTGATGDTCREALTKHRDLRAAGTRGTQ